MNRIRLYFRRRRQIRQLKRIKKNAQKAAMRLNESVGNATAALQAFGEALHEQ